MFFMRKNKLYQGKNFSVSRYNMQVQGKKIKQEIIEQKMRLQFWL